MTYVVLHLLDGIYMCNQLHAHNVMVCLTIMHASMALMLPSIMAHCTII